ncbi:hypothetical protein IAE37_004771 [Pseudomonas sp. S31]|uniref:hypothetical protein n=1 Tax=Pseudomonas sp. S31 TaxID=1564473 RepID=UPI001912F90A|nr:hypothetical protein [Pseudomonas sp. S31]MBK5002495.1 hypothetical protein [Pseudomonas sp. S31]
MNMLKTADSWPTHVNYKEPDVPAIVRDENDAENPQGILTRAALDDDLEVIVPERDFSQNPAYSHTLELGWRPEGADFLAVARQEFWPPIDPVDKRLTVPHEVFPDELYGVITDDYLTQHGEVPAQVLSYLGMRGLDKAVFYWSEHNPLPDDHPALGERI